MRGSGVLLGLAVVDAAGYSVIAPVLPAISQATGAGPTTIGVLAAMFPLAMLPGLSLSGWLIRRGALRPVLFACLALLVTGSVLFAATDELRWLLVARAVMGVGSGGVWMAVTMRTLEAFPGDGYRAMSRVYAAYSVGALVGPALGGLPGTRAPFVAYAFVVLVCAVAAAAVLHRTHRTATYQVDHTWRTSTGFWYAAVAIMLGMLAVGMVDGVLPLHLGTLLTQWQIGLLYLATALATAVAAVGAGRFPASPALVVGTAALLVGLTVTGASTSVPLWIVGLGLVGVGAGALQTGATGVLLDHVATERIVGAMTVWSQLGIAGYFIAPIVGGPVAEQWGYAFLGIVPLALAVVMVPLAKLGRTARPWARRVATGAHRLAKRRLRNPG